MSAAMDPRVLNRVALTAKVAATTLRSARPATPTERTRKDIARDLVRDIRVLDQQLTEIDER
jgi:transposase